MGLMKTSMVKKIETATRKEFPSGIPAFGTDALRFTFYAIATPSRDINFDVGRLGGYRNFCNKLWNAARYVLMHAEGEDNGFSGDEMELTAADHWIQYQLNSAIKHAHRHFEAYRFDKLASVLYSLVWENFCDWYLEFSKVILND